MFNNKKKVLVNLLISGILLVVYLGVSHHYGRYTQVESVEKILHEKISQEINEVESSVQNAGAIEHSFLDKLSDMQPYRDLIYFKNDSLVYYSTNEISWQDTCLEKPETCLVKSANRYLIVHPIAISSDEKMIHLVTIKMNYDIPNRFLNNEYVIDESIPSQFKLKIDSFQGAVHSGKKSLFSIHDAEDPQLAKWQVNFIYSLFALFLLSVFISVKTLYEEVSFFRRKRFLRMVGLALDIFIILFVIIYFQIPGLLFDSYLFDGSLFIFPGVFPNFGVTIFILTGIAVVLWTFFMTHFNWIDSIPKNVRWVLAFLMMAGATSVLFFPYMLIKNLSLNSSIALSINQPDEVGFVTSLAGLAIFLGGLSTILLHTKLMNFMYQLTGKSKGYGLYIGIAIAFVVVMALQRNILYLYLAGQLLVIAFALYYLKGRFNLTSILIILAVVSVSYSMLLEALNDEKENNQIRVRAISLLNNRDKISEFRFSEEEQKLNKDNNLQQIMDEYDRGERTEQAIISYIRENYFRSFHLKYDMNYTLCESNTELIIDDKQDQVDCYTYFADIINEFGVATIAPSLYYIDDGDEIRNYIGRLKLENDIRLFIDIYQKSSPLAQGYPELLESEYSESMLNPEYSYAVYYKSELINSYGDANYPTLYSSELGTKNGEYEHFTFSDDTGKKLVISKKRDTSTEILAGVTYFILGFGLMLLFFYFINQQWINYAYFVKFRSRLQLSIFSILLVSFIIIGLFVFSYISKQNENKNRNNLEGLSQSIRIELEHKLAYLDNISDVRQSYIYEQLIKFSQVFFSDINLYDRQGKLVASSRPRIFERNIISSRINPEPYFQLRKNNQLFFIHREKIGDYSFLSAYFPLRNYDNKVIAYVNLPYFSKQRQLAEEISTFLTTFINIYVILTIVSLFFIWIISNYITKPMETIKNFIRKTKLQAQNAKIDINRKDEIGDLVREYNSMVDELQRSAQLLAASERETAWREMARQVAHEIKNPLTPMKLSVQQFERTFKMHPEKSEQTVNRFTQNMIQQIDSLSEIATAFSDFAKMPKASLEKLEVKASIQNTLELFEGDENVTFRKYFGTDDLFIKADKKQIQRVFINLFKNSIQALSGQKDALVEVEAFRRDNDAMILIKDNGPGIPEDKKEKIFLPNFTTKSGGTGLGLAMVRNIVRAFGGAINLVHSDETGTVFRIIFPLMKESEA